MWVLIELCLHILDIPGSLHRFLVDSSDLRLPGLHADSATPETHSTDRDMLTSFSMSKKKGHEVEQLSKVVAELMTYCNLKQVKCPGQGWYAYSVQFLLRFDKNGVVLVMCNYICEGAGSWQW